MMWGDGWGGAWGAGMVIVMIVVLALVVAGIVLLVRALTGPARADTSSNERQPRYQVPLEAPRTRALDVLEERYARGEIDREEFLQRRQDLLAGKGQ
jgi:putative membrane protein